MRGMKVFWGIALVFGAVALLLDRGGYLGGIGFWPIVFDICLVAALLKGIAKRSFGTILFSLAFLVIVNDKALGLEAITPVPVLLAALLGTMGLKLLFPKFDRRHLGLRNGWRKKAETYSRDENRISYHSAFTDSTKYLSGVVGHLDLENAFGNLQVYFTETVLEDHKAIVKLDNAFGNVVIYVPAVWKVVSDVQAMFGDVQENGSCNPYGEDVLYMQGEVWFGNLEIVYVGEEECVGSDAFIERKADGQ